VTLPSTSEYCKRELSVPSSRREDVKYRCWRFLPSTIVPLLFLISLSFSLFSSFLFFPNSNELCIYRRCRPSPPWSRSWTSNTFFYGLSCHWCNRSAAWDCVDSSELTSSPVSTLFPSMLCTTSHQSLTAPEDMPYYSLTNLRV
jgi:hypothetical protein